MSSVYLTEPATAGKVCLHTSFGDIDIELWPREAPKACRNFVQLCLEGYYDGTPWHRVVPGVLVQGGDATGTGRGGTSIYGGAPFADEYHTRLKFNHRGLVACANSGVPGTNNSQFFVTLDKTPWLQGKHTIFGKVTGDTIYNVLRLGEVEVDKDDAPIDAAPIIKSVTVLSNPFDDIVPRATAVPRSAAAVAAAPAAPRAVRAVAARNLLSFGADGDGDGSDGDSDGAVGRGGAHASSARIASAHELLARRGAADGGSTMLATIAESAVAAGAQPSRVASQAPASAPMPAATLSVEARLAAVRNRVVAAAGGATAEDADARPSLPPPSRPAVESGHSSGAFDGRSAAAARDDDDADNGGEFARVGDGGDGRRPSASAAADEYHKLREEVRAAKRGAAEMAPAAPAVAPDLLTPLQQLRAKYVARKGAAAHREQDTLAKLAAFQTHMRSSIRRVEAPGDGEGSAASNDGYAGEVRESAAAGDSYASMSGADGGEGGEDSTWMAARLKFTRHIDDKLRSGGEVDDGLVTLDPLASSGSAGGGVAAARSRDGDRWEHDRGDRYRGDRDDDWRKGRGGGGRGGDAHARSGAHGRGSR